MNDTYVIIILIFLAYISADLSGKSHFNGQVQRSHSKYATD